MSSTGTLEDIILTMQTMKIQQNFLIKATYEANISGCYIQVAALQRCKCIESHHLGLELGGCNNEVAT